MCLWKIIQYDIVYWEMLILKNDFKAFELIYIFIFFLQKNIYYYLFFDESQVLAWLFSTLSLMI